MKFNKVLPLFLCFFTVFSWAKTGDTSKPIYIDSTAQEFDMQTNTVIFTGSVNLIQGTLKLKADKVLVKRPNGEEGAEIVEAYGNPALFDQVLDNGKPVHGQAQILIYDVKKDLLTMKKKALLKQVDSQINGEVITYEIEKQKLKAQSKKKNGERVTTILTPTKKKKESSDTKDK